MATRKDVDKFLGECAISPGHLRIVKIRLDGIAPLPEDEVPENRIKEVFEGLTDLMADFKEFAKASGSE